MGFRVEGLGCRIQGARGAWFSLCLEIRAVDFRVSDLGFRFLDVRGWGSRLLQAAGCGVLAAGLGV